MYTVQKQCKSLCFLLWLVGFSLLVVVNGVRAFHSGKGCTLYICSSRLEKYVVLQCDRNGLYCDTHDVSLGEREKTTGTCRINCPLKKWK